MSVCSGSSITTPLGTYSSVPPDQQAACSAANLSACGLTTRNKVRRGPGRRASRTKFVEAAEEHALLGPFWVQSSAVAYRHLASGEWLSRVDGSAAQFDAVREQGRRGVLARRADGAVGAS